MAPCKVKPDLATGAPLALSYPHFYMVGLHYNHVFARVAPFEISTLGLKA